MAILSLSLLGPFTATINDQPLPILKSNKAQALLIYLAIESDRPQQREFLFSLLWPDMPENSARHNLSQTLYALRKALPEIPLPSGKGKAPLVFSDHKTISLNREAYIETDIQ